MTKNSLLTLVKRAPKSGRREIIPAHEKGAAEERRQDHVATIFPFSASLRRFTSSEPGAGGEARHPRIVGIGSMRGAQPPSHEEAGRRRACSPDRRHTDRTSAG